MSFVMPPKVAPRDVIAVVAPSSGFEVQEFWRGLAWLRDRYRLRVTRGVLARAGYLAGEDARRAAELARAMTDPDVKAIVAARGGYGAMRILDTLPWEAFARSPKWMVGFSDVTALHAMAWARGIASVHAPHVTGLAGATPWIRAAWLAALERPWAPRVWEGLRVVRPGTAEGPIVGGNLSLVEAMAASGKLALPDGAILALEDVTERPYRLDRMLTALRLGGHLARVAGIVLGSFARCEPGSDGVEADAVLMERTAGLAIPVVAGAPFGHEAANEAFILGARARIAKGRVELGA